MTREELQDRISYLERTLQRKAEQVASDERAITKCDDEVNKLEITVSKAKNPSQLKTAQSRLNTKRTERQRKMKTRDVHKKEQNSLSKQLLSARQQLSDFPEAPIAIQQMPVNPMEKIYQVFISSTYEDLIMERQEVMAAVVSTGNVPVGMEYFPAGDASPFDYIKQQIDQVDYYILVLAGKYGTVNEAEGISYTEMEFNYAREKKIPIAVLLYKDIDNLTGKQLEKDPVKREKLETFRKACKNGRMADFWENRDQLKMKVKDAIRNLVNNSPRSGWIRATSDTLAYNANKVNKKMLDEEVELHYESSLRSFGLDLSLEPKPKKVSMANILGVLSSVLRVPSSEMAIDEALNARYSYLEKSTIDDIKRRLIRAGWVKVELVNIDGQGIGNAWTLTPLGFQIWANLPQN